MVPFILEKTCLHSDTPLLRRLNYSVFRSIFVVFERVWFFGVVSAATYMGRWDLRQGGLTADISRMSSHQVVTPTDSKELFLLEYIALQLKFIKLRFRLHKHCLDTLCASIWALFYRAVNLLTYYGKALYEPIQAVCGYSANLPFVEWFHSISPSSYIWQPWAVKVHFVLLTAWKTAS